MFVVTNRDIADGARKGSVKLFGKKPNEKGPNELRMAEAVKRNGKWELRIIPDELTPPMRREVGIGSGQPSSGGRYLARKLLAKINPPRARKMGIKGASGTGKNFLLFVHGYNNDVEAVLDRAAKLARNFNLEVLPFTWPANGGGGLTGLVSYKSDKRDAKVSIGALDRVLAFSEILLSEFNLAEVERIRKKADEQFGTDLEKRDAFLSKVLGRSCPFTVNALFHSMGNYLYKNLLKSGSSQGTGLLFDNVVLAAADTNNARHAIWVDRIKCRKRVYITINEDDKALAASRMKSGDEQLARLGHYTRGLNSQQGVYVDFTNASHVGDAHAYFEGTPVRKNSRVKRFFMEALNGKRAEERLGYDASSNIYRVK